MITALVGRNGAGKSTRLNRLLAEADARTGKVALVPQEPLFSPGMTVVESLLLAYLPRLGLFENPTPEMHDAVRKLTREMEIDELRDRRLETLSSGERQRVVLGRALLQRPRLLLLDEPTNHLDPGAVTQFWKKLVEEQKREGFEVIAATHDLGFVLNHATKVIALEKGAVCFEGPPEEFKKNCLPTLFKASW